MSLKQDEDGFKVVGLSKVVRNDDPAIIGALWEVFRSSDVRTRIGADASKEVYCVYHDYEGGFMDPYRMTIRYRAPTTDAPEGFHCAEIPKQSVMVYDVKGPQPQSLIAQWQSIWNGELNRTYLADYDVYDADEPEAVSVRVGVKTL
jgi:predicted transcriptional regulator YdeE